MDEHAVPLLCDPETHASLRLEANDQELYDRIAVLL